MSVMFTGSIYEFKVDGIDGKPIELSKYKGKKILIVNTASECGYTPQYGELEELFQQYQDKLVVIGFPANNFGGQEPGSNSDIQAFCKKNYGVNFPLAAKVSVKGSDIHPLFDYLTKEAEKMGVEDPIKWNFTKFLIDEKGKLLNVYSHKISPLSEDIQQHVK